MQGFYNTIFCIDFNYWLSIIVISVFNYMIYNIMTTTEYNIYTPNEITSKVDEVFLGSLQAIKEKYLKNFIDHIMTTFWVDAIQHNDNGVISKKTFHLNSLFWDKKDEEITTEITNFITEQWLEKNIANEDKIIEAMISKITTEAAKLIEELFQDKEYNVSINNLWEINSWWPITIEPKRK